MKQLVITGANRGIGLAFVQHYLASGWQVRALCRQSSPELDATDADVVTNVDVSDLAALAALATSWPDNSVDLLINNAGVFHNETLADFDLDRMQQQLLINSLAPIALTQAAVGALKPGSKVIMITSRMGSISDNGSGAYYGYRMSKAALNAASVSLARDLAAMDISVGILHPGYVQTRMVAFSGDISAEQAVSGMIKKIDDLSLTTSGQFWHSNGQALPW